MKRSVVLFFFFCFYSILYSNGVGVINPETGTYLKLLSSTTEAIVEDQVSIVTTMQSFLNTFPTGKRVFYFFPMPEEASAIGLDWKINGVWHSAAFIAGTDTTLHGGTIHPDLIEYIGPTPLFFSIPDTLMADSVLIVRLKYVQLLHYEFGKVLFKFPNDYHLIQSTPLDLQELNFNLTSQRTIDSIKIVGITPTSIINTGHTASVQVNIFEQPATTNYLIEYSLNLNELGLFSMSSFVPDTLLPDSVGRGFFVFVAEPNPNQTDIIDKVFTLLIDRSGSMSGIKMQQAKEAAKFIVNNLNAGDMFNIIDFDDIITSFKPGHVPFNEDYKAQAITFINALTARGMTNISGAFGTAIPQFINVNDSTANIIIFLTDGQPTAGITNIPAILEYVNQQVSLTDTSITIFTFGIGNDVNMQLLSLLASQHHGLSEFLRNDEVLDKISKFYLKIRNPVLMNTQISITPPVALEINPSPLPNLYKGQQLIVAGRYQEPALITITLSGNAFGQPQQHQYSVQLADTSVQKYMFLTKIWAKLKIENLLVQYYSLDPTSPPAILLKNQIIWLSINYGVSSPFTYLGIPVELTSFTAVQYNNSVQLNWSTASELNNRGFEIERRTRTTPFVCIGFVTGNGTTTEKNFYSFIDNNVTENYYIYRLKQYDYDGKYRYSEEIEIQINPVVEEFFVSQNYPNPFNPVTSISYTIPVMSNIKLEIYNILGEVVEVLVNSTQDAGHYKVSWDASAKSSGVYFYKLTANSYYGNQVFTSINKMVVIK